MATNTSDFYSYSKTAGTSKNLQKPLDGGDNNVWGTYINTDLDTVVAAVNAISNLIADANENELIDFTATGSAVNHIGVTNAATGNPPQITAAGDDTNIDLTLAAKGTGDVNITPGSTGDVNIPANKGITFASDGNEKIESNDTDLTVNSGGAINLTATTDVVIPADVGVTFGTGEKIEGNDTDLTLTSGGDISLTATSDVNIPSGVGLTFASDGNDKIESNDTDLTINSGGDIDLTATTDINIPQDVGLTFGADGEKIEGNGTKLDIAAAEIDFSIEGSGDINIPANIGLTFASDNNDKIESDDTDLTVSSGGDINLTATSDVNLPAQVGLTFGADTEKIEADASNNITHTAAGNITLDAAGDITLSADGDNINFDDGTTSRFGIGLTTGDVTMTDTDAEGALGPELTLYRNSSSPVASDLIGAVSFAGEDDNDDNTTYARIQVVIKNVDHAGGNEAAEMQLQTRVSNALSTLLTIMSDGTVKTHGTLIIGG